MLPATMDGHPTAAILPRNSQPTIFFPFTITTFSCSGFRFPLSHHHPSTNVQPTLLTSRRTGLTPALSTPGPILPFTSDIQSSLALHVPFIPPPSSLIQQLQVFPQSYTALCRSHAKTTYSPNIGRCSPYINHIVIIF